MKFWYGSVEVYVVHWCHICCLHHHCKIWIVMSCPLCCLLYTIHLMSILFCLLWVFVIITFMLLVVTSVFWTNHLWLWSKNHLTWSNNCVFSHHLSALYDLNQQECRLLSIAGRIWGLLLHLVEAIKVYVFVMTRPRWMQDADNDVNGDWPDEELQTVQKIKQFWRKLSENFANLPILRYSNLV